MQPPYLHIDSVTLLLESYASIKFYYYVSIVSKENQLLKGVNFMKIANENTLLEKTNIREVHYEDWFTRSGENKSYFIVYLNIPQTVEGELSWLEIRIPFNFEDIDGDILPAYTNDITDCELHINSDYDGIDCELDNTEKVVLINECIRELVRNFACMEFNVKKGNGK